MRIVCDTNVFISAILFGGAPYEILLDASKGFFEIFISQPILDEIERVLRTKFKLNEYDTYAQISYLEKLCTKISPETDVNIIKDDLSDNKILECALDGKVGHVVSGDRKHILPLKKYKGICIYSPQEFLKKVIYN